MSFKHIKKDFPASVVVFLVAMPLCLGIALASGAPLFSGLIAGVVGGLIVGSLSDSPLGVSGPAAGLAVIVLGSIKSLGGFEFFLSALVLAGCLQLIMGYLKAGVIAYYFPSPVIHGMLSGIGILIFLKQVPHAVGYDKNPEGNFAFLQPDQQNTFSELFHVLNQISVGPFVIAGLSLIILLLWETPFIKRFKVFQLIQGPLVAVVTGIILSLLFQGQSLLQLEPSQLVQIPVTDSLSGFWSQFQLPNFSKFFTLQLWTVAFVLAIVGSLETLLCVEASDKQDPQRRITPTNRELKAQGVGNMISGLIGGLPVTQVIVRSSVNVQAGGQTKMSAIIHGGIILLSVVSIPNLLNLIPLSTLAAILLVVGYKLAKPKLFIKTYKQGMEQFLPFVATVAGILLTDLLIGIMIGLTAGLFFVLYNNYHRPTLLEKKELNPGELYIKLSEELSFLKKAHVLKVLKDIPDGSKLTIDASETKYIHQDILDLIEDFKISAKSRNIQARFQS